MMKTRAMLSLALLLAAACGKDEDKPAAPPPAKPKTVEPAKPKLPAAAPVAEAPVGLPETPSPQDNPTTADKVELGAMLFFDPRISDGGTFSCETCHVPEKGWADGEKLSAKHDGNLNTRHSPTLFNVAYVNEWYWDGRMSTLEAQIMAAWKGQVGATPDAIATKLNAIPGYAERFQRAFGGPATGDNIVQALAAFVRTIRSGDSAWDRYEKGDKTAVSEDVVAGFEIFTAKANCALCHAPPLYMDTLYHNAGVGYEGVKEPDPGRGKVTSKPEETGAFKTPGLRGVALHPPYFHDGSAASLEDAVDFMLAGGYRKGNKHIDPKLKPAKLSAKERDQLLAFIRALSPDSITFERPELP